LESVSEKFCIERANDFSRRRDTTRNFNRLFIRMSILILRGKADILQVPEEQGVLVLTK
jgi:hypothetical protein